MDSAASFTFGQPDTASATATVGDATTGAETSETGDDPTLATGGISDSATPTTGVEETTGEDTSGSPTSDGPASTTDAPADCEPGETRACYTGPVNTENVGNCTGGTQTCGADGTWAAACDGEILPADETCNGEDDDCNGSNDDGNPGGGGACSTGLSGPCQPGTLLCVNGALICDGDVTPAPDEICGNNIDDDCQGGIDDGCSCDPGNPGLDCAANESCFPTVSGDTVCAGPTGVGTQYDACVDDTDCAPGHVCVNTGQGTVYCMQWCTSFAQCPFTLDDCVGLDPAVFADAQEWGVCYDGFP